MEACSPSPLLTLAHSAPLVQLREPVLLSLRHVSDKRIFLSSFQAAQALSEILTLCSALSFGDLCVQLTHELTWLS